MRWDTIEEDSGLRLYETLGVTENEDVNQANWAHNYCRNLGGDPSPSCFINSIEIDYCDIPNCNEKKVSAKVLNI